MSSNLKKTILVCALATALSPGVSFATYSSSMYLEIGADFAQNTGPLIEDYTRIYLGMSQSFIEKAPVPSIMAQASTSPQYAWNTSYFAATELNYTLDLHGTANAVVPVDYRGAINLAVSRYGWSQYFLSVHGLYAGGSSVIQGFCSGFGVSSEPMGLIGTHYIHDGAAISTRACGPGWFIGQTNVLLDATGYSQIQVSMMVEGVINLPQTTDPNVESAYAYLDPYFEISAPYLAEHPGFSLQASDGFGNAAIDPGSSVPEPTSLALLGLGLFGLARSRTRNLTSKF